MKHSFILLFAAFLVASALIAQNKVEQDSIIWQEQKKDSVKNNNIGSFVSHQTDAVIGSVFGKSQQLCNADSIINQYDSLPAFGIYKDNYFIIGTQLFEKPTKYNSDAKFQVSIRHRLTNSVLPFRTYLYLTYTQKAYWSIFQESFPFRDVNMNPTIGLGRALIRHNRFLGTLLFQFEHESNGKDGEDSRSWNKISLGTSLMMNDRWTLHAKAWIPIIDGENNKDLVHYAGWGFMALNYSSLNKRYKASLLVTKRGGANLNANITANISIGLFRNTNQYLFIEYYNGYGESLLDYDRYHHRLRIGFVLKSTFLNNY